jgi:Arc/MetJ-type ribon-helix-helix transcriptional regulator
MTIQITIRLPDDAVEFLDEQVRAGRASSRAQAVAREIKRAQRRLRAEQDIPALLASQPDEEMNALAEFASTKGEWSHLD